MTVLFEGIYDLHSVSLRIQNGVRAAFTFVQHRSIQAWDRIIIVSPNL